MTTELPRITTMPTLFCSLADTCAFENQARISHQKPLSGDSTAPMVASG